MSGGRYDYLFTKDATDLIDVEEIYGETYGQFIEAGVDMAEFENTESILKTMNEISADAIKINEILKEMQKKFGKLYSVLQALEYYKSSDWSKEEVEKAIKEYNEDEEERNND